MIVRGHYCKKIPFLCLYRGFSERAKKSHSLQRTLVFMTVVKTTNKHTHTFCAFCPRRFCIVFNPF